MRLQNREIPADNKQCWARCQIVAGWEKAFCRVMIIIRPRCPNTKHSSRRSPWPASSWSSSPSWPWPKKCSCQKVLEHFRGRKCLTKDGSIILTRSTRAAASLQTNGQKAGQSFAALIINSWYQSSLGGWSSQDDLSIGRGLIRMNLLSSASLPPPVCFPLPRKYGCKRR